MSLSIVIDLSDQDLQHFKAMSETASKASAAKSSQEILQAAADLLIKAQGSNPPAFVKD